MEMLLKDPEIMKTVLIGTVLFLIGVQSAVGEPKRHTVMILCLVGTLICILVVWFKGLGGSL